MTKEEAIHVINQVRDVITKDPSWYLGEDDVLYRIKTLKNRYKY